MLCLPLAAGAQTCPVPQGAGATAVARTADRERLKYLATTLRTEGRKALLWHDLWGAGFLGLMVGQTVISGFSAPEDKVEWYVGIAASGVGLAFSLINPLGVASQGEPYAMAAESASEDQVCALIEQGERLLEADAKKQKAQRSWVVHALTGAFNAGVLLVLGLGFGRWRAGITDFLVGEAIGTANALTRPNGLNSALSKYRGDAQGELHQVILSPLMFNQGAGFAIGLTL